MELATFLLFIHCNEHSRLVSICGHGNRRLHNQNTQIITEVDVKVAYCNGKVIQKTTEIEQNCFKKL